MKSMTTSANKDNTFLMVNEDGEEMVCSVLFTFDSEKTNKSYIAFTDNTVSEDGSLTAHAAIYHPENLEMGFEPIETDEEWHVVEVILDTIQNEVKSRL